MVLGLSIWDFLFPNLTVLTMLGIIIMVVGIVMLNFPLTKRVGWIMLGIGFLMAWGWSWIEDIWDTTQGRLLIIGLIFVLSILLVLFAKPHKAKMR